MDRNRSNQRSARGGYREYENDNYGSTYGGGRNLGGTSSYGSEGHYGSRQGRYSQGGSYGQGGGYHPAGEGSTYGAGGRRYEDASDYGRDYDFGASRDGYRDEYENRDRHEDRNFFERIGHGIRNAWDRITGHDDEDERPHIGEAEGYDYSRRRSEEPRYAQGVSGNHGGASYSGTRGRTHQGNLGSSYGGQVNEYERDWQNPGRLDREDYGQGGYGSRGVSNYGSDTHWGGRYGSQGDYHGDSGWERSSRADYPTSQYRRQQGSPYGTRGGNSGRGTQRESESYGGNYGNYGTGRQSAPGRGHVSGFGSTYGGNYSGERGGSYERMTQAGGFPGGQGTGQNQWRDGRRTNASANQAGDRSRMGYQDYETY